MKFPFKEVVFDGGSMIELLLSGNDSDLFKSILNDEIEPKTTNLAIIETQYILCRKIGMERVFEKVDNLIDSNFIEIQTLEQILKDIRYIKM